MKYGIVYLLTNLVMLGLVKTGMTTQNTNAQRPSLHFYEMLIQLFISFFEPWTDEKLYKKYNLSPDEIAYIESLNKPME